MNSLPVECSFERLDYCHYLRNFQGHNVVVMRAFAETFDGKTTQVGDVKITVTEETLASITGLENKGENWFKAQRLKGKGWTTFMDKMQQDLDWGKGVPRTWLSNPWRDVVFFIQKYLTCEGRYSLIFLYHILMLQHIKDKHKRVNMHFYLLKILTKMAMVVRKNPPNKDRFLYHHALVKILVLHKLEELNQTWQQFLSRNNFEENEPVMENPIEKENLAEEEVKSMDSQLQPDENYDTEGNIEVGFEQPEKEGMESSEKLKKHVKSLTEPASKNKKKTGEVEIQTSDRKTSTKAKKKGKQQIQEEDPDYVEEISPTK
jgi:hypothetical protein